MEWIIMENLEWRGSTPTAWWFLHQLCYGLGTCPAPVICMAAFLLVSSDNKHQHRPREWGTWDSTTNCALSPHAAGSAWGPAVPYLTCRPCSELSRSRGTCKTVCLST